MTILLDVGLAKEENQTKRKVLLWTSILVNLGFLGFFKYYNFFLDNFITAFSFFGTEIKANSLNIILPVGISFYTFQTLSYTIDVYKRKLEPTKDFIAFSAFVVSFLNWLLDQLKEQQIYFLNFIKNELLIIQKLLMECDKYFGDCLKKLLLQIIVLNMQI